MSKVINELKNLSNEHQEFGIPAESLAVRLSKDEWASLGSWGGVNFILDFDNLKYKKEGYPQYSDSTYRDFREEYENVVEKAENRLKKLGFVNE